VPVEDAAARARLIGLLETCLADNVQGRRLTAAGAYERPAPAGKRKLVRAQELFYRQARDAAVQARRDQDRVFEPQRPAAPPPPP